MGKQIKISLLKAYRKIISILAKTNIHKTSFAKNAHARVVSLLVPKSVHIGGHKIFIDKNDYLYLSTKKYEPFEHKIIEKLVKKGDVVVDIGANLGFFTLILARKVGPKGKIFAFEPDPEMFELLKKNVKANGYKNVVLVKKALMDKKNKFTMNGYAAKGDSGVIVSGKKSKIKNSVTIDGVRLDDYLKDFKGKIDFIKMDIEGAEGMAFAGMQDTLSKNRDIIFISEFFPKFLDTHKINSDKYYDLLCKQGFKLYSIDEDHKRIKIVTSKNQIIHKKDKGYYATNLICVRNHTKELENTVYSL